MFQFGIQSTQYCDRVKSKHLRVNGFKSRLYNFKDFDKLKHTPHAIMLNPKRIVLYS